MKKFIAIMVMLLIGLVANAQITNKGYYYSFKLGEYVFGTEPIRDTYGNLKIVTKEEFKKGVFYVEIPTNEEAINLVWFVREHKTEIEEKYGVYISSCGKTSLDGTKVAIHIYEPSYYKHTQEEYMKKVERENAERERENAEREKRINSLNEIL